MTLLLLLQPNLQAEPDAPPTAPAVELPAGAEEFDLVSEEPWLRVTHRRTGETDVRRFPAHPQEIDSRPVREFVVTIVRAKAVELWRLREIWAGSSRGTSPVQYPERVHQLGIGDLPVTFVDPTLVRRYANRHFGSCEIRLREWRG